jgi:hypothetical protein
VTTVAELDIVRGDVWFPENASLANPAWTGDIFADFTIFHSEDGTFYADAGMWINFIDGFDAAFGRNAEADDYSDEPASEWLNDHLDKIEAFFTNRYGCEWDGSADQWSAQRLYFSVTVEPDETIVDVYDRLRSARAVALYNESDRGTFGCDYVFRLLREHIEKEA